MKKSSLEILPYEEVISANSKWRHNFNNGNSDLCTDSYHNDGIIIITDGARYHGHDEIRGFWNEIIASGAHSVIYNNIILKTLDSDNVILSADWEMNIYKGKVVLEKWRRQQDGEWLLIYDEIYIDKD